MLALVPGTAVAQCPVVCPTADDASVQQMLDAAGAAGGGVVQLEPRVYQTCEALIVPSNTHLRGAGRGATIIRGSATITGKIVDNAFAGGSISTVGTTNVSVSDLTIDHATCSRNANGVAFLPTGLSAANTQTYDGVVATNGLIERVEVLGSPSFHSYMIWNLKGQHMKILDNWVDGGASVESNQEGIESFGGNDVLISGNTVRNIGYACLNVGSAGLDGSGTEAVTLVNNFLTNCQVGINLGTSTNPADQPQSQSYTRIIGNIITAARFSGIDVAVVPGTVERDLTISANTIRDIDAPNAVAIRLRSSAGTISSDAVIANTISQNHIENIRGTNAHGIRLTMYPNVRVMGNTVTGADYAAIYAVDSNDLEIVGNRVEYVGQAPIQLWATPPGVFERFVIDRNLVRDWPGPSAGIVVSGGKFGTIKDNVFMRPASEMINPIVVSTESCGIAITGNVPWYFPNWKGLFIRPCP